MSTDTLMHPYITDALWMRLFDAKIDRTDREIDRAVQGAFEAHWAEEGHTCDPETMFREDGLSWDFILNSAGGILDLLDIDSEDGLYDRRA